MNMGIIDTQDTIYVMMKHISKEIGEVISLKRSNHISNKQMEILLKDILKPLADLIADTIIQYPDLYEDILDINEHSMIECIKTSEIKR